MPNKRPKRIKYNKYQKGRISFNLPILNINQTKYSNEKFKVKATTKSCLSVSLPTSGKYKFQLIALEPCRLTASQIGAAELALKRNLKNLPNFATTTSSSRSMLSANDELDTSISNFVEDQENHNNIALWEYNEAVQNNSSSLKKNKKKNSRNVQLISKVFPHLPVTKKPAEVRMGKGKGNVDYWMCRIKVGTPLFEIIFESPSNTTTLSSTENKGLEKFFMNIAKISFKIVNSKLPIKTTLRSSI